VPKQTYGDLEGDADEQQPSLFPARKHTKRDMLEVVHLQAQDIHDLLQKVLGPQQRLLRDQEERRLRELARRVVQEELFEQAPRPVVRKKADKAHKPAHASANATYPDPVEFEVKLRATIKLLCDPEQFDKLTIERVRAELHVAAPNTVFSTLKRHGYVHAGETQSKCLNRLADEWEPQWRGVNRQRW
jgi:hypothetical protein